MFEVVCQCGKKLKAPEEAYGRQVQCRSCGEKFKAFPEKSAAEAIADFKANASNPIPEVLEIETMPSSTEPVAVDPEASESVQTSQWKTRLEFVRLCLCCAVLVLLVPCLISGLLIANRVGNTLKTFEKIGGQELPPIRINR